MEELTNLDKYKKEDVFYVTFFFIFIDKKNEIENIQDDIFELNEANTLSTSEISAIIERNKINNNNNTIQYSVFDLMKYNFDAEPSDIITNTYKLPSIVSVNYIHDILFQPTILFFQSLNCIYVLLKEKNMSMDNHKKTHKRPSFFTKFKKTQKQSTFS